MSKRGPPATASALLPMYASVALEALAVASAPETDPRATPIDLVKALACVVASAVTLRPAVAETSPPSPTYARVAPAAAAVAFWMVAATPPTATPSSPAVPFRARKDR